MQFNDVNGQYEVYEDVQVHKREEKKKQFASFVFLLIRVVVGA